MFERCFLWTMRHGSRLMFGGAALMLLAGIVSLALNLTPADWDSFFNNLTYGYLAPAAYLLFGAVLTHRLRREADSGQ